MKRIKLSDESTITITTNFEYNDRHYGDITGVIRDVYFENNSKTSLENSIHVLVDTPALLELDRDTEEFIKQHYLKSKNS